MAKTQQQEFSSDWTKTVNWADSQKIAKPAVAAVYALDNQRVANGEYPMSQAERTRAILSAANLDTNTVLPTDIRKPSNVLVNAQSDLSNIFTGLSGIFNGETERNIWDGFKNAITDPTGKNLENLAAQWIPGVQDIEEFQQGGISNVLSHPIVSMLDVLPIADTGLRAIAKAGLADTIAERAGITADQLATAPGKGGSGSVLRVAGKLVSNTPARLRESWTPGIQLIRNEDGTISQTTATIGSRVKDLLGKISASPDQAALYKHALSIKAKMTALHRELAAPFYSAVGNLKPEDAAEMNRLLTTSGKTPAQILTDDAVSVPIKQAIDTYIPVLNFLQEQLLSTGEFQWLTMPDGSQELYSQFAAPSKAAATVEDSDRKLAAASKISDNLAADINRADGQAAPYVSRLDELSSSIYQTIHGVQDVKIPGRELPEKAAIGQLLRKGMNEVTDTQIRSIDDIFAPGGLVAQLKLAYDNSDFKAYKKIIQKISRRFKTQALNPLQSPELSEMSGIVNDLYSYGKYRDKLETQYTRAYTGKTQTLMEKSAKDHQAFEKSVLNHPPDRYRPIYNEIFARNLMQHIQGANKLDDVKNVLLTQGHAASEVAKASSDPRVMAELISVISKSASEDPFAGILTRKDVIEVQNSAFQEVARLRAQGFSPTYVPSITSHELRDEGSYNVKISLERVPSVDAAKSRLFDYTNTVNDISMSVNHAMLQSLARDGTLDFIHTHMPQFTYDGEELRKMAVSQSQALKNLDTNVASAQAYLEDFYSREFGLVRYDPESLFNLKVPTLSPNAQYIPRDIADAISSFVTRDQLPASGVFRKSTEVFRTSVLAFSPRFTAHITFGGSFLVGLRSSPFVFKFIGDAYKIAKQITHGQIKADDPLIDLQQRATQFGSADEIVNHIDKAFRFHGAKQLGNMWMEEIMDKTGLDKSKLSSYTTAAAQANYRLTNFVVTMQRALVYLDGADKVSRLFNKRGYILDESGHRVELTAERAHFEGMKAANKVMGDLREMTPLEKHTLTQVMPFYGWTKHVLRYVSSYPMDHPYRAMFLSNMANLNSEQVPTGLPTRIQLLFQMGSPDANGNVNTLDIRALNPLRDTANYMTFAGLFSALNPAITGLAQATDPQATFGGVPLYPNLTYSDLYGAKGASAPGSRVLDIAESYIPQISALDVALNLSGQYRNLRKTDPASYVNAITTALGIPFTPSEINLKEMAAKNEISKYQVASQLAQNAWETGDFGPIANLPSVPDPLQPDYNITPAALQNLYNSYLKQYAGVAPAEVAPELPAPANI